MAAGAGARGQQQMGGGQQNRFGQQTPSTQAHSTPVRGGTQPPTPSMGAMGGAGSSQPLGGMRGSKGSSMPATVPQAKATPVRGAPPVSRPMTQSSPAPAGPSGKGVQGLAPPPVLGNGSHGNGNTQGLTQGLNQGMSGMQGIQNNNTQGAPVSASVSTRPSPPVTPRGVSRGGAPPVLGAGNHSASGLKGKKCLSWNRRCRGCRGALVIERER